MKTHKFILLVLFTNVLISCKETVVNTKNDELLSEYKELKEALSDSEKLNFKNAESLNQTLTELAEISGNTMLLRQSMESGTAKIKQAEQISIYINNIKDKIEKLEKQNENNSGFGKTIQNLKILIIEKEKEISELKKIIANQENIISEKEEVIQDQNNTISQKELELKQAITEQAYLLYQAGVELEQLADAAPDVSRKKNKKKVDEYQKKILSKAIFYYEKAAMYGYSLARNNADRVRGIIK